ncbi:TonB-dependent receptor [Cellvibrio polysaccharolyticus]|uniref:TonB-dependent receptor n=1 Tax=Cellvibrio polysaccharolyticus TaxID=2082724 RepID=A0A928V1L2_9GAMM|nr:TonB-dependent receptor [Cellvibrio polysaccharolyticus]MBE8717083.1 TonB-dependent receptor [Cellvibrio polysaccharolyticus]
MTHHHNKKFTRKTLARLIRSASTLSFAVGALGFGNSVYAQEGAGIEEIIVSGQRGSVQSAQLLKQNAEQIVDSIVSDDIGKLPDRSITEAIQRISGVTIERFISIGDPEHFSAEGSGVAVRGMRHVRSELNGRDSFSASGGRSLSFEDVPAELMAGVDVYKNPSADMIEGGLGGTVNLRTKMPLELDGQKIGLSASANYGDFIEETKPSFSALYSNRWDTNAGEMGILLDVAYSDLATRTDGIFNRAMFARTDIVEGQKMWLPKGADWRTMEYQRERLGTYGAFQWRPSDTTEVYLTAFRSSYDMQWNEDAIFVNNDPWTLGSDNAVFENGVFRSGRLYDTANDGMSYGADIRASTRESKTTDFSGGVKWQASDKWSFSTDLQYTKSTTDSLDSTVATAIDLPYLDLDLTGRMPKITSDASYLADPGNYYWAFTMPHIEESEAEQIAFRIDGEYTIEDSFLRSIKFGARATDRTADNIDTAYNWQGIYQPWMKGWKLDPDQPLPKIQESEYHLLNLNQYPNFFKGKGNMNGVVWAPSLDLALGYPKSFQDLHGAASPNYICCDDFTLRDKNDPDWSNRQEENTYAVHAVARFGFADLAKPIDGNIGVRVVRTEMTADGFLVYPDFTLNQAEEKPFNAPSEFLSAENSYTNVLPSLNLRMQLRDDVFLRFAASQAISRPDFSQLKSFRNLEASFRDGQNAESNIPASEVRLSSTAKNPYLKPIEADQFDVSAEWYFDDKGGMIYGTLFHKSLTGIIRDSVVRETYNGWDYNVTRPENVGSAKINGFELGYNQFFDMLPAPWDGLGLQVNYTYIDSSTNIPDAADADNEGATRSAVDTDGTPFPGKQPYEGLSKNAYNIIGMYEKGPVSVRLAWSWRSEYLMAIGANGYDGDNGGVNESNGTYYRLPIWSDDSGQLDGSIFYNINDNFSLGLEVNNITNSETRTIMKQIGAGDRYASFFVNDTRYALTLRANF